MKQSIYLIVIVLLIGYILFIKMCSDPQVIPDDTRERELLQNIEILKQDVGNLLAQRDSLLKIPTKIKTKIVYKDREIDENIAKDSSNSINEYRKALASNNETVEGSGKDALTFREIALGAKYISRVPQLKLQLDAYEDIVNQDNEIIESLNSQIDSNEKIRESQRLAIVNCVQALEKEKSWYNSNYLWFGGGVVVTAAIVLITGIAK